MFEKMDEENEDMWLGIVVALIGVTVVLFGAFLKYKEAVLGWVSLVSLLVTVVSFAYTVYSNQQNITDSSSGSNTGTEIDDTNTDDPNNGGSGNGNGGGTDSTKIDLEELQLCIEEWKLYEDGYHYEEPTENPGENIIVDFERGIMGKFSYSRELTKEEKDSFSHTGELYDEFGHKVGNETDLPSYFSSLSGTFILEFPKELPAGKYTYELIHYIFDRRLTATINFTIE